MSRLLDDDQDEFTQRERELTLSAGAILAIFLGLILLCAVFFGFGYNLGRKSTTTTPVSALPAATNDAAPPSTGSSTFDSFKPSPSSPSAPSSAAARSTATPSAPTPTVVTKESANITPTANEKPSAAAPAHTTNALAPPVTRPAPPPATTSTAPAHSSPPQAPAPTATGSFVVQIAAISATHKDDADLLVSALNSKGYQVMERIEPQDKLIHIQVGPYTTKAEAEAMRERLIVDGYNAIVK